MTTFAQYINNPMGIKNGVISNREMYRTLYTSKLDKILVRENGKINYQLFKDKESYYVYIKVPSEVITEFYYDVLIKLSPDNSLSTISRTLKDYDAKFYSNDPSFVFTFAHAFIEKNMFFEDMRTKMSKEAVKKVAKERNPRNDIGYVKSLYFAYLIMNKYSLFEKIKYESSSKYNKKEILNQVMYASDKIELRQEAEVKKNEKNRKLKIDTAKQIRQQHQNSVQDNSTLRTKITSRVGSISSKTGKNSRTVKRTKRI